MEQKIVKLENPRIQKYAVTYEFPDGLRSMTYTWRGCKLDKRDIVEVPYEVYEWLKYDTHVFQNGKLIVAEEEKDEVIKEDIEYITEDIKVYKHKEIVKLLEGNIKTLKKEITKETDRVVVEQFIEVAREINLDSDSKKTYLADLVGMADNKEYIFPVEK